MAQEIELPLPSSDTSSSRHTSFFIIRLTRIQLPSHLWLLLSLLILASWRYFLSNNHLSVVLLMECVCILVHSGYLQGYPAAQFADVEDSVLTQPLLPLLLSNLSFHHQCPYSWPLFAMNSHLLRRFFI